MSLFYLVGLFDLWWGLITIFISAAGAYSIAAYIKGPYMPWVGFVFLMGYMSVSHIYRQIVADPALVDITGAQMVLVMKLTAFCWNVYDGTQPESTLDDYQKDRALRELPSLLDYAAYVLFFPALMVGPAFDYVDYRRWIETTMFELPPGTDPAKAPPTRKQRKIPRSGTPATWKAVYGLLWILAYLQLSGWYNGAVLLGDKSTSHGLLRRIFMLHMLGVATRTKYYGVWSLTEGACILSGIGYKGIDPKTGKADWSRLQNVNPMGVELAQNSHAYLGNWNMNTNNWLRNYIYLRVTPRGKKPGFQASMATFVTSAFWHGFYPGYYLTFVLASFMQNIAKSKHPLPRPYQLTDTVYRLSAPIKTILHVSRRKAATSQQTLLRLLQLPRHTAGVLFLHGTICDAYSSRFLHGMGSSLFLRHHWHHCRLCLSAHSWQAVATATSQSAL